jgi:hypothetical protein
MRFVPKRDMTIVTIAFATSVAAGSNDACDVGILDSSGTKIVSSGATTGKLNATAGVQSIGISSTPLKAGTVYYAAFAYGAIGSTAAQLASKLFGTGAGGGLFEATPGTIDNTCQNLAKDVSGLVVTTTLTSCFLTSNVPVLALRES